MKAREIWIQRSPRFHGMTIPDENNPTSEGLVRIVGLERCAVPSAEFPSEAPAPGMTAYYLDIGAGLAGFIGLATFVGAYIYCIATYGFVFGFGLGWIPSGIVAIIVSQVVRFFWGPIILLVALVIFVTRLGLNQ